MRELKLKRLELRSEVELERLGCCQLHRLAACGFPPAEELAPASDEHNSHSRSRTPLGLLFVLLSRSTPLTGTPHEIAPGILQALRPAICSHRQHQSIR
jgi:hypothetical protein